MPATLKRPLLLAAALALAALSFAAPSRSLRIEAAAGAWTGTYYNNTALTPPVVLTRTEDGTVAPNGNAGPCKAGPLPGASPALDCFWMNSPGGSVNADGFSVAWERTDTYAAGTYRFTGTTDDGMRIKVDGVTVVDAWFNQPPTTYYADKALSAGSHLVRVEFYDASNNATAQVTVQDVATLPAGWTGQYFANKDLTGAPALTRNDPAIDFDWNLGSPAPPTIPVNQFSARWTRTLPFNDGVYQFTTTSDDGARVYVDGVLILNFWVDQSATAHSVNKQVSAGDHIVVVEYYENTGGASMIFGLTPRPDLGGFVTDTIATGLTLPTVFAFLPDGRILIGQKNGTVKVFKNGAVLPTPYYTVLNVNNNNDRGLLGMTADPNFASNGYVYIAYTRANVAAIAGTITATSVPGVNPDVITLAAHGLVTGDTVTITGVAGDTAANGTWVVTRLTANTFSIPTTAGPAAWTAGGTVTKLDPDPGGPKTAQVIRVNAATPSGDVANPATKLVLLGSVVGTPASPSCENFAPTADCIPSDGLSHSMGNLKFGPDGMLYVATGDGTSYSSVDPLALRSQSKDRLAGKILRVNPANGQGLATNPFATADLTATRSKVWAYGLRNAFRFNFKPGTNVIFNGDVGWDAYEEINVVTPGVNLGWPCYEGNFQQPGYAAFAQCTALYGAGVTTFGIHTWAHAGSSAAVGGAFSGDGLSTPPNTYKAAYQNTYWFGDYAQDSISVLKVDGANNLVPGSVQVFSTLADGPVQLEAGPEGDIYYLAINVGELRRIRFVGDNRPPVAVTSSTSPMYGLAPLTVNFSSAGSNDPDLGQTITYEWDFGDGSAHSTAANPSHLYNTTGNKTASLTVTDSMGLATTATLVIQVGNTPPAAAIATPADLSHYDIGDLITFSGSATDAQDPGGVIPPSSLAWSVVLFHCPDGTFTGCHPHTETSTTGTGGNFTVTDHGDFVYFEIFLTATDAGGLTDTKKVKITANTVDVTFTSDRAGTQLTVDGTSQTVPFTRTVPRKSSHVIFAPSPQTLAGGPVYFNGWSDGGAQQHTIVANAAATYTAFFVDPTPTPTNTPTPTATFTPTNTPTLAPTDTPAATSTPTDTPTPTSTPTATDTPTATFTPTDTATPTLTATSTPVPTATSTPVPTATSTATATATATVDPTLDTDGDGVPDVSDNCRFVSNADQLNTDAANTALNRPGTDALGDACDDDIDGDGYSAAQEAAVVPAKSDTAYCDIMRADVDGDRAVTILDMTVLAGHFLLQVPPAPERDKQDADNAITILDLTKMANLFLQNVTSCP